MKKLYVGKFGLLLALMFSGHANAQIPEDQKIVSSVYDYKALSELAEQFNTEYQENRKRGLELAERNGWATKFVDEFGNTKVLYGATEDGAPIYAMTSNFGGAKTIRVDKIQPGGAAGLNLTGEGMIMAIFDSDHPRKTHQDFVGRYSTADGSDIPSSLHATHVLGTMLGSGVGDSNARGMAYQAHAWINSWDNDINKMTQQAGYGLVLSNHSYTIYPTTLGTVMYGAYITRSQQLDNLTFNAPYYQPVFAAGNDRNANPAKNPTKNGNDLIYSERSAKNIIVVAAVNEVGNYTGPSSVVMSSFSNYGPTDDFRIKPTIAAKGVDVYSTSNTSDTAYAELDGTSMAAPTVTGAIGLLQQHYKNLYGVGGFDVTEYMKSATVRGVIYHTADEAGDAVGPDHKFGYGLMNAEKAANLITNKGAGLSIIDELRLLNQQQQTRQVYATGNEPLVVSISWTDKPGATNTAVIDKSTPVLVNDLDVRVFKDGVEYFPWALNKSWTNLSVSKMDNNVDNYEKIEIPNPTAGEYTIVVSHKGNLSGGFQDFTLIASGINLSLGVQSFGEGAISVWPNPVNDILNIDLNLESSEVAEISIFDINGRKVFVDKTSNVSSVYNANLQDLSSGIYFLKVNQGNKSFTQKLIKK